MSNAGKDDNGVSTLIGVLNSDGTTVIPIKVNSSNSLMVSAGSSGSDKGPSNAKRDENDVPTLIAVSSSDGRTPVVVYADSSGNLLVNYN